MEMLAAEHSAIVGDIISVSVEAVDESVEPAVAMEPQGGKFVLMVAIVFYMVGVIIKILLTPDMGIRGTIVTENNDLELI